MRQNPLRERFADGRPTIATRVMLPDPAITEAVGQTGVFDYVEFLAEYNAFTLHDLDNIGRAAELYGLGTMVKLDYEHSRYLAQRAVGSGFGGVLFADMRTREDVVRAVASVRPDTPGHGGAYGAAARRNARPDYGGGAAYITSVAETVVGVMVEKRESFDDLDALLSVPGIDFVQWGPTDFRMSSGRTTTEIDAVRSELFDACARNGVPARIELADLDEFSDLCARGFRHFSLGIDIELLFHSWKRLGTEARALLRTPKEVTP
ncbi:aldolase/citrate lyase family protein [Streptomyces tremellae]|uniref:HpcH/HpaI aldolase/citrate lyase domain-containing protein n=1 Tax=Streptomyces tremellae TaxID=1124239 RepID=A0ABP7EWC1_9ACTN